MNESVTKETLLSVIRDCGFPQENKVLTLFLGGSSLHGAKLDGKSDLDICGVYLEPYAANLGLVQSDADHFVFSSAGQNKNSTDDIDITMYSLRRWAQLAIKGNPTILGYLFANQTPTCYSGLIWDVSVVGNREKFACKAHGRKFHGYADEQMRRVHGQGTGRHGQREDLIAKYGYDTKAAMHITRLYIEGIEYMLTGGITFPSVEKDMLLSVRRGEFETLDDFTKFAAEGEKTFIEAREDSELPEFVDVSVISQIIADIYYQTYTDGEDQRLYV